MRGRLAVAAALAWGCSEFTVTEQDDLPPADPPGADPDDDFGGAPDWNDCPHGYVADYYNLPADHPDVEPDLDAPTVIDDPLLLDWWDDAYWAFERFDASLEHGTAWYPVDEGLAADPDYFSARYSAWIRVNESQPVDLVLGASTDAFVFVNGELKASVAGSADLETTVVQLDLPTGQFPLEVRYAHRAGEPGLRMRFASEHVAVCYPDFDAE